MLKRACILVTLAAAVTAWPDCARSAPGQVKVWFGDLAEPIKLPEQQGVELLRYAVGRVKVDLKAPPAPAALAKDDRPRVVFLSVSDGRRRARVFSGAARGLIQAVDRAAARAAASPVKARWIKLDVVTDVQAFPPEKSDQMRKIGPTLHGLAFSSPDAPALIPETLTASPPPLAVLPLKKQTSYRFRTAAFFTDGAEYLALYRGHRRFEKLDRGMLLAAARLGGAYLSKATGSDGRFAYNYLAASGRNAAGYNALRHAGTIYAMMELYEITRDKDLLSAASVAIGHMVRAIHPAPGDPQAACLIENAHAKLGGNGLAMLALAKYTTATGDRRHMKTITKLGRWVLNCQGPSGGFNVHKQAYPSGRATHFRSEYYPGEAMFALTRLHGLDGQGKWLDAAERAAGYLIDVRDSDKIIHDHWQLYALNELYRQRPKKAYLAQAMRIANAIVEAQNRKPAHPDWLGSFKEPPRSTPTATRMEGLTAAYALARDFNRPDDAKRILEALRLGIAHQMQAQIRPETAMYMKDPRQSLGGVRRSLSRFDVRIDYVQHNMSALLGMRRILGGK